MSVSELELLKFLRMNKRMFSYDDFGIHLIIAVATQCCVCELTGDYEEFSSCTNKVQWDQIFNETRLKPLIE